MQARVDDDARGAEDRGLELVEDLLRILEEPLLAHHPLSVERPALREVRRAERLAHLRRVGRGHDEMPVVAGIGLVHRRGRDAVAAVPLEPALYLLLGRPVGWEGHEEVARERVGERGWTVVRGDREDRALEVRRRLDEAALAGRQRHEAALAQERPRALGPFLVLAAHALRILGVMLVQPLEEADPVVVPRDVLRYLLRLR